MENNYKFFEKLLFECEFLKFRGRYVLIFLLRKRGGKAKAEDNEG